MKSPARTPSSSSPSSSFLVMATVPFAVSARPSVLAPHGVPAPLPIFPARVQLGHTRRASAFTALASQQPDPASLAPPQTSQIQPHAPIIELEFVGPDPGDGGSPVVQTCTAVSGEKLLRNVMLDNQIELYGPYGKMMNCEGRGMCGTCLVDILEGAELMNKRTDKEPFYLKLRPDSWRLACQATVGDGTKGGKIKVKTRPQKGNPLM